MRMTFTILGTLTILTYSVLGAMLLNDWAFAAASEESLKQAIATMDAAGESYSATPGYVFAAIGVLLTLTWATLNLHPRVRLPAWGSVSVWATVLAFGAPAYFLASFGNLMSVGDTYPDWNAEAAHALAAPLYLVSGAAAVLAVGSLIAKAVGAIRAKHRDDSSRHLSVPAA